MAKPPPDPLFVFHEGMDSVFCLLFVLEENIEMVYAGTGDGNVHIWDLKDNRRLKTNKVGDSTCLQLHRTEQGQFITQEKSGPTIFWIEASPTREWTQRGVIPSSYVGFCRSVITQDMSLIVPCEESTLKIIFLQERTDEEDNLGCEFSSGKKSCYKEGDSKSNLRNELEDSKKTLRCELGFKIVQEKYLCCEKDEKVGEVMALKSFDHFLLALYESGELKLWCLTTGKCLTGLNLFDKNKDGESDCPMTLDYDEKSGRGMVGSSSVDLIEFSVVICEESCENRTMSCKLVKNRTVSMKNPGASFVRIRADGKIFVVGCWDGRIRLYSFKTLKLLVVLDSHRGKTVQDVVFAPEKVRCWSSENMFASAGLDGRLCLWSIY